MKAAMKYSHPLPVGHELDSSAMTPSAHHLNSHKLACGGQNSRKTRRRVTERAILETHRHAGGRAPMLSGSCLRSWGRAAVLLVEPTPHGVVQTIGAVAAVPRDTDRQKSVDITSGNDMRR